MDVFQTYAEDIDDIMETNYKNIRIHLPTKGWELSAKNSVRTLSQQKFPYRLKAVVPFR